MVSTFSTIKLVDFYCL